MNVLKVYEISFAAALFIFISYLSDIKKGYIFSGKNIKRNAYISFKKTKKLIDKCSLM